MKRIIGLFIFGGTLTFLLITGLAFGLTSRAESNRDRTSARSACSSPPWNTLATKFPPSARTCSAIDSTCSTSPADRAVSRVRFPLVFGAASLMTTS